MRQSERPKPRAKKIRAGYYEYRGWEIELLDEQAERYPGDTGYGEWRTYDYKTVTFQGPGLGDDFYETLKAAKEAIDEIEDERE
jgi:hypothetical protein